MPFNCRAEGAWAVRMCISGDSVFLGHPPVRLACLSLPFPADATLTCSSVELAEVFSWAVSCLVRQRVWLCRISWILYSCITICQLHLFPPHQSYSIGPRLLASIVFVVSTLLHV
ncbi:unnamed protein product [Protopolystoma xenopodis]|uniref:Uncharacterized protein n=1 Tax=Protopolystoma xenopodis TaxID=117903 RepID=A0A3S5FD88_9PLAT|nr:unnamed protein product [Protopolystoma xenopodis]